VQRDLAKQQGGASVQVVQAVLKKSLAALRQRHQQAERDFKDLLALPVDSRIPKLHRARRRFRGVHLVYLLLAEAERFFTSDVGEARHFAELAYEVAQHSAASFDALELLALSQAYIANSHRAGGDLREAEQQYVKVRHMSRHFAVSDPAVLARIDELEASLRKDQRRFAESAELLARAVLLYQSQGSHETEIARALVNLGDLYYVQGAYVRAVEITEAALKCLNAETSPRLYACGRYNLALQLVELGEDDRAAALIESDREFFRRFPEPWTQLRLLCLQAKIVARQGDLLAAVRLFCEARDGFLAQGIGFDAAIVSVELALLYLQLGHTAAIKTLASELHQLFQAQDVHREAAAALLLFQQAIQQEAVTVELAQQLALYLERARVRPELRFELRAEKKSPGPPSLG
jgi:tetratricopeptide (TPR) repeat protein